MASCGGCTVELGIGTRICHCSACHETFSVVSNFDKHRTKTGKCLNPESAGLRKDQRDIWVGPPRDMEGT